ncbi:ClpP family protease [Inconstantimicrobium porci]|uniref:Clp protease n=1 Tax=Inconstantimicrobium porci TaxID=2652291 RepID=A0A7X2MW62_9CLOT|nr:ATP-dependent Clp protease proteolytic subunit [Inconstantimicrobium porci]MDD6772075.1 ATP-dependent Clp protease proteolytic subunit [Inconstantimicrobium porci]MSR90169.1 Clp protease [Inconstantimicrobium porci]
MEENKDVRVTKEVSDIKELGNTNELKRDKSIQVLSIIGQIEGHAILSPQTKTTKYEHMIPQLVDIEENPEVKGVLFILNTVGGDVEAGLAMAELITSLSKPTVSLVIGGGHSIGVPLATASNYSFISPSATMIIHPIRMNGLVIGVPQTFNYFQKMQQRINSFITRTSKIDNATLENLMMRTDDLLNDMGTILIGKEAVNIGLINEVGGIKDALKKLKELIAEKEL